MVVQLRFGIVPREWGDFTSEAVEQAKLAEKLGFHSVWVEEHHGSDDSIPSPLTALAALSQHVPSMRVGTAVAILPLYHPVRFASDAAVLDVLSRGKFTAGVAVGYSESEFQLFGMSLQERGGRMEEALEIVRSLWEGKRLFYSGKYYRVEGFELKPRPLQTPRPPIWVGGWKRKAIERAARLGDRWFPGPVATFSYVREARKSYLEALRRLGKEFKGFPLMRDTYIAPSEEQALRDIEKPVMHMYAEGYARSGHPLLAGHGSTLEDWVQDRFLLGTPSHAIELISQLPKDGVDYMVLRVSLTKLPHRKVMDSIRLFGEKVLPYFRAEEG